MRKLETTFNMVIPMKKQTKNMYWGRIVLGTTDTNQIGIYIGEASFQVNIKISKTQRPHQK